MEHICSYRTYLSSQPSRIARYLFCTLKGQTKILGITRNALEIAEFSLPSKEQAKEISYTKKRLREVKIILLFFKTIGDVSKVYQRYQKASAGYKNIYRKWERSEEIGNEEVLKTAVNTLGLINKILSVTGNLFFKPLKLISKQMFASQELIKIAKSWEYVVLVKSGMKIGYGGGRLLLGTNRPIYKTVGLVFEVWGMALKGLKVFRITPHPAIIITHTCAKLVYNIYEIYAKTV